jgi:uncharacterized coiled-coil DUF342 family protein
MPTVDERLAALEAKVDAIGDLRGDVNRRFAELHHQLTETRTEMNQRFTQIDQRFNHVDARFTVMDAKIDRLFVWVIGLLAGGFTSVIGALIAVVYR